MPSRPLRALILSTIACLAVAGCKSETRFVAPPEIKPAPVERTLVGYEEVFADGRRIGELKTYEVEQPTDRRITMVVDDRGRRLGYLLDDGTAYRFSAHGGENTPIANSPDRRRNVAAVFGIPGATVEIRTPEELR